MLGVLKRKACGYLLSTNKAMNAASSFKPSFDPYRYTHGRWLDRNDERQEARRLHFDFDALLDLAIERTPGAKRVISCDKKEGGFNRVFVIQLDNGKTVVARLPTKLAGSLRTTVSSEVATLRFVKESTKVPVPDVLAWSSQNDNPIGAEYILMDEIPGVLLKDVWNTMPASQHIKCIQSIARMIRELCSVNIPYYGSIYHSTEELEGVLHFHDRYDIGPLCGPRQCANELAQAGNVKEPTKSLGPWYSLEAYYSDHIERARSYEPTTRTKSDEYIVSGDTRAKLIDAAHRTIQTLICQNSIRKAGAPLLSHPDLHTRNIFVRPEDPTVITGIIDWQSTAVEPAFVFAAETPDFAEDLPEQDISGQIINDGPTRDSAYARLKADVTFCVKTWSIVPQICSKFREASELDASVVQLLAAPSNGWLDDADSVRSILSDINKKWVELGLPGESIYQETHEEAEALQHRMEKSRASERLREHLSRRLGCDADGWVPMDRWEEVLPHYQEEYRRFIASVVEDGLSEEDKAKAIRDANALWPFDQR